MIGPDGEQAGIVPVSEGLKRALELGLDLVEVSPSARPPVCRIMDYGKYKYELAKKDKAAKKKQHTFQVKEMRYRPKIDDHDYGFKTKHVRQFLEAGSKVRAMVFFRGRERAHTDFGRRLLERLMEDVADIAIVDSQPKMEGHRMNMVLSPRPEVVKRAQEAKTPKKGDKVRDDGAKSADPTDLPDNDAAEAAENEAADIAANDSVEAAEDEATETKASSDSK